MKKLFIFLSLSLFFYQTLSAQQNTSSVTINSFLNRVSQSKNVMPVLGTYKNQFVENNQRRTLMFLTESEKKLLGIAPHKLAFANFRHNKEFYVATIDHLEVQNSNAIFTKPIVEKIVLSKKHWAGKIRLELKDLEVHSELVFYLKDGFHVNLVYNQSKKLNQIHSPQILKSLVLSVEAIRSQKEPNAPFFPGALGPNFAIGHRIVSLYERNEQHRDDPNRTTSSFRINFSQTKANSQSMRPEELILIKALYKSNDLGRSETYHIISNNCTNTLFRLFDENLKYNQSTSKKINLSIIKSDVNKFVKNDLNDIIAFLEELSNEYKNSLDEKSRNLLREKLINFSSKKINTVELEALNNPSEFLFEIPAFINTHLKARGLI
jgi:hypothetical protein